jgi:GNAT superfamily N-acetyltransferase
VTLLPDQEVVVRRATAGDAAALAELYLRSFHATYAFPLAHTDSEVRAWVRDRLVPEMDSWVAVERSNPEHVVGFMTLAPGWLEHLYVDPDRLGEGIGRRLLELAKQREPGGLLLWTFQVNARARRFYERNGFTIVRVGDESNNEEHQPDIQYAWGPPEAPAGR